MSYFRESFEELKKVSWPSRKHAINITIFTIVFTFIATVFITFVDNGLNSLFKYILDNSPKAQNEAVDFQNSIDPSQIKIVGPEGKAIEGVQIEAVDSDTEN